MERKTKTMRVGDKFKITNGKHSAMYVGVSSTPIGLTLKRIQLPKSKADGNRLADNIVIENLSAPFEKQLK